MGLSWSRLQQKKNAKSLMELVPMMKPGQSAPLPKLNANDLNRALSLVAAYLAKNKRQVTVIAIGGAVNTIFLRSRESTQDVDFFNNNLTADDYKFLIEGAKAACKRLASPKLPEDWFNNHTIFFIPQDQRQTLTNESIAQNEFVFKAPGLTVLAAPWYYAFCSKVDRIAGSGINAAKPYDFSDAVVYIKRYLRIHNRGSISVAEIRSWFAQFGLRWTPGVDAALAQIKAHGVKIV